MLMMKYMNSSTIEESLSVHVEHNLPFLKELMNLMNKKTQMLMTLVIQGDIYYPLNNLFIENS